MSHNDLPPIDANDVPLTPSQSPGPGTNRTGVGAPARDPRLDRTGVGAPEGTLGKLDRTGVGMPDDASATEPIVEDDDEAEPDLTESVPGAPERESAPAAEPVTADVPSANEATAEPQSTVVETGPGGIMTDDAGAITGAVVVTTTPTSEGTTVQAAYEGALDIYVVTGSPVTTELGHDQIVEHLVSDAGVDEAGNAHARDLTDL